MFMNSLADLLQTCFWCSPLMLDCCPKFNIKGEYLLVVVEFWLWANSASANYSTQSFCGWFIYSWRYCSMVTLYHSVCPSVCGWYAVEEFPYIHNKVYNAFMNDKMNWGPQSEIIFWEVLWSLNMWSLNIVATPFVVILVEIHRKQSDHFWKVINYCENHIFSLWFW